MTSFHIHLAEARHWHYFDLGERRLWLAGPYAETHGQVVAKRAADVQEGGISDWLDGLDGHFGLILVTPEWLLAAVDPVRSIPILWSMADGELHLSQCGMELVEVLGLGPSDIDAKQALAFAQGGFTIGAATLYDRVKPLMPGQYLVWHQGDGAPRTEHYHFWRPFQPSNVPYQDLIQPLSALHHRLIEDLIRSAQGRTIVAPLSAGLDSRMIVSGLAAAGYRNVLCVAYGQPENREAKASRQIAARLGYPWEFVAYDLRRVREGFFNADHQRFWRYSDSLTAVPFTQDYLAMAELRRRGHLPPDAILVNGQSGDFTSGNHVPASLFQPLDAAPEERAQRIVKALMHKHFKHWQNLEFGQHAKVISELLIEEISKLGLAALPPEADHGVYEFCEFNDRQSKYVINGQRCYESLGLSWRLPLWDRANLDFWEKAPLATKIQQKLYREVLSHDNWGGVWDDIPINALSVRPGWLKPVRWLARALHAPLGRKRWHRFEKQYFDYFMAPLCSYAPWTYRRVASDRRGFRSPFAWYAADYLERKGLRWDGISTAQAV